MEKYRLLRDLVATNPDIELIEPAAATNQDLLRAHDVGYIEAVTQGKLSEAQVREIGFPWTDAMVERSRRSAGATIAACLSALTEGVS